jgi:hypothetical protein
MIRIQLWISKFYRFKFLRTKSGILLLILAVSVLVTLFGLLFSSNYRSRVLGIGLPSPMVNFQGHYFAFSIDLPKNWIIFELPSGNHGDMEAFATISATGRVYPGILLSRKLTSSQTLSDVSLWGENREQKIGKIIQGKTYEYDSSNYKGFIFEYERESTDLFSMGSMVDCKDWYMVNGANGYSLAFCAEKDQWNEVKQVFNTIIESFLVGSK